MNQQVRVLTAMKSVESVGVHGRLELQATFLEEVNATAYNIGNVRRGGSAALVSQAHSVWRVAAACALTHVAPRHRTNAGVRGGRHQLAHTTRCSCSLC